MGIGDGHISIRLFIFGNIYVLSSSNDNLKKYMNQAISFISIQLIAILIFIDRTNGLLLGISIFIVQLQSYLLIVFISWFQWYGERK